MTSSLHIKILKIDKFGAFSCDIDYNSKRDVFRDGISLIINQCTPGDRREPPADTKCPPAAQRKQAKRACMYIYIFSHIFKKTYFDLKANFQRLIYVVGYFSV